LRVLIDVASIGRNHTLRLINAISVFSAMVGIYKSLGGWGVLALGGITSLFLIYSMSIFSIKDGVVDGRKSMLALLVMLGIESFWCMFHIKTFEAFDGQDAVFGNNTSLVVSIVVASMSFIALLIQSIVEE